MPIENVPRCVYAYDAAVVKFGTDIRIPLAINFVPRESAHVWACRATVQNVLAVFDLDIFLPGFDDRTIRVSPGQAVVQVRMIGPILQIARSLKRRSFGSRTNIDSKKFRQSQIRVLQVGLRIEELWSLVCDRHLRPLHI